MKHARFLAGFFLLFTFSTLIGQMKAWQPSPGHTQVLIWPVAAPDPQPVAGPERTEVSGPKDWIAGKPVTAISNVTHPTVTVYSPSDA